MKLNLGCGKDIKKGWINLDKYKDSGVDIVHDLNNIPLPFEDEIFNYILCKDVLEHVNFHLLMEELHRILKKKGLLRIRVPHFTSKSNYADPTHINFFSTRTFEYFIKNTDFVYNKNIRLFSNINTRIHLEEFKIPLIKIFYRLLENWVNKSARHQKFYERSFLRIFSALSLEILIIK